MLENASASDELCKATCEQCQGKPTERWPIYVASGIALAVVIGLVLYTFVLNDDHLIFTADDAYIHMATAKNFSQQFVWGVSSREFSSSTSSLLWPLLLSAGYWLTDLNQLTPLLLNIFLTLAAIFMIWLLLVKTYSDLPAYIIFFILLVVIFATPLPPLVLSGMETSLYVFITIFFVYISAVVLSGDQKSLFGREAIVLFLSAFLLTLTRFDGIFISSIVLFLFLLRRRWLYFSTLFFSIFLPVVIYGVISIENGWMWLPNSVLVKSRMMGNIGDFSLIKSLGKLSGYASFSQMMLFPNLLIFFIIAIAIFVIILYNRNGYWDIDQIMLAIFILGSFVSVAFLYVSAGEYRYTTHLLSLGIFVTLPVVFELLLRENKNNRPILNQASIMAIIATLFILPLVERVSSTFHNVPRDSVFTYRRHVQAGLFLEKYYYKSMPVIVDDIGAPVFYADIKCLDLWGLGDKSFGKLRMEYAFDVNADQIQNIAISNNAKIAVIFAKRFNERDVLPADWEKVGVWTIINSEYAGNDTVSFYAVKSSDSETLMENLRQFSESLPQGVYESGRYTEI